MKPSPSARDAAKDIFYGQIAIIWARWFFILATAILALWSATDIFAMTLAIVLVVVLMATNFFVHGRYLMDQPVNRLLLMGVCLLDLGVASLLILGAAGPGGLASEYHVFLYPLLFAFALVFSPRTTLTYTLIAMGLYATTCWVLNPEALFDMKLLNMLSARLIILAAMGGLGTYYWRVQRERRRELTNRAALVRGM